MKWQTTFPSKYVKAEHLTGDLTLRIVEASTEPVVSPDGKEEDKLVVLFEQSVYKDGPRRLILNRTNARRIATITDSDDTDLWAGVEITLTLEKWGDKDVVRIKH